MFSAETLSSYADTYRSNGLPSTRIIGVKTSLCWDRIRENHVELHCVFLFLNGFVFHKLHIDKFRFSVDSIPIFGHLTCDKCGNHGCDIVGVSLQGERLLNLQSEMRCSLGRKSLSRSLCIYCSWGGHYCAPLTQPKTKRNPSYFSLNWEKSFWFLAKSLVLWLGGSLEGHFLVTKHFSEVLQWSSSNTFFWYLWKFEIFWWRNNVIAVLWQNNCSQKL